MDFDTFATRSMVVRIKSQTWRVSPAYYLSGTNGPFSFALPINDRSNEKLFAASSPISHVSRSAPPVLLIHGDVDRTVPYQQSVAMEAALRTVNVPVTLLRIPGGDHGPDFGAAGKSHPEWPDYMGETVQWLDRYLKTGPALTVK
jgi:dipeptidyl aminopeptidase/acylaminoacyl peptidase